MWESESETYGGVRDRNLVPEVEADKHDGLKPDGFIRRDQSWYVSSDIPSDLIVKVGELTFHLHKYPLLSRSGKMNRIIYETSRELEPNVVVELNDLPGGYEAFELAAKFCYGIAVDLTAANIAGLRCAAEYLEMTEDLEEGNLIFKTEAFLSYVVLSSWRDSIVVLKSCEGLSPWAENLQIVRRCSESIAWKACANPRGIRWAYGGRPSRTNSPKWAAAGGGDLRDSPVPADWWFEDVSILRIDHFVRVVTAIKVKGMRHELIGASIMQYAAKWLPGLVKDNSNFNSNEDYSSSAAAAATAAATAASGGLHMIVAAGTGPTTTTIRETEWTGSAAREQRMVVESLISIIPPQRDSVTCGFLLRLLRQASLLKVAPALVTELEKRVGMQLEQASLSDLMIPAYYSRSDTMLDVDLVQRLVEHFVVQEQTAEGESSPAGKHGTNAKMRVARLIDSYLTEVSRDRNLSLTKFQVLAEALPDSARSCDDGLYRAVDSYLKAHPTLTEHERKRLCRVMDCQKLSMDACMHAAQNERLPLRVVVQVLFSEQVKISNAIANSTLKDSSSAAAPTAGHHYQPIIPTRKQLIESTPQSFQEGWAAAKKDINMLKFELESMKNKYAKLQNEMDGLQRQFDKMTVTTAVTSKMGKHGSAAGASGWTSGWKKFSRLTKMGGGDGQEQFTGAAAAGGGVEGEGAAAAAGRKGTRRWRNSIS